jgi:protein-L-isoaspartate O-methyltransferase
MESNESIYRAHDDPWGYFSAAEQIKYERTIAAVRRWKPRPQRVLEVACSLGYMTRMLASYADEVWAYDVSPTAVERARERCADVPSATLHIDVGDALAPAYPADFFDVIFVGDVGLGAHRDIGGTMIRQAIPLLREEGLLVVVDNMKPRMQESYAAFVERQGIEVIDRIWFDDRYWARFRRAATRVLPAALARPLVRSRSMFGCLAALGRCRGPWGSKHFGVVARRRSRGHSAAQEVAAMGDT